MDIISKPSKKRERIKIPFSLCEKIICIFAAVLFVMIIVVNVFPTAIVKKQMTEAVRLELTKDASSLAYTVASISSLNGSDIGSVVTALNLSADNKRIVVVNENASVMFDSIGSRRLLGSVVVYAEVLSALTGKDTFYCLYDGSAFHGWASVPIMKDDKLLGAVYIYEENSENAGILRTLEQNIRAASILTAVATLVLVFIFTSDLRRRLSRILEGVREVGNGNFDHRINMTGRDELMTISDEFDSMCHAIKQNEKMRQQFVSDASHELKTPLASIKLLSDSIVNNDNIDREEINEFLGDISSEIGRLTRISESLISINQASMAPENEEVYPCDLGETVARVYERLKPNAELAGVTLNAENEGEYFVIATEDGLYHIVFNLVENAVKYNRRGGRVDVRLSKEEGRTVLTVADTGIGIPEHEQKHVFERFFRVDKMRSRETGGSGLGLSIVKEWVTRFNADIKMKSVFGEGTVFSVVFDEGRADL